MEVFKIGDNKICLSLFYVIVMMIKFFDFGDYLLGMSIIFLNKIFYGLCVLSIMVVLCFIDVFFFIFIFLLFCIIF